MSRRQAIVGEATTIEVKYKHVVVLEAIPGDRMLTLAHIEALKVKDLRGYKITNDYLSKIMADLVRLGYVTTKPHPDDAEELTYGVNQNITDIRAEWNDDDEKAKMEELEELRQAAAQAPPQHKKAKAGPVDPAPITGNGSIKHFFRARADEAGPPVPEAEPERETEELAEAEAETEMEAEPEVEPEAAVQLPTATTADPPTRQRPAPQFPFQVTLTVPVAEGASGTAAQLPIFSVRQNDRMVTLRHGTNQVNAEKFDLDSYGTETMVNARVKDMAIGGPGITTVKRGAGGSVKIEADGSIESVPVLCLCYSRIKGGPNEMRRRVIAWCSVCKEPVDANNSRLGTHLLTDKHKNGVLQRKSEFDSRRTMTSWLRKFREKNRCLHGDTVSDIQDQYRLRVTRALMSAGIPLNKLECEDFVSLLTDGRPSLTSVPWLRSDYIPLIRLMEQERVKYAIGTLDYAKRHLQAASGGTPIVLTPLAVIFDGSTLVDNHLAVVFRFCTSKLDVFEVAVALTKYQQNRTSQQLVNAVEFVCSTFDLQPGQIITWMRDRCSVNTAAIPQLVHSYGGFDGECFSHTLDNCDVMEVAHMQSFTETLVAMMSACGGNNKCADHWENLFGATFPTPNNTRWWSVAELQFLLQQRYDDVCTFILTCPGDGDAEGGARLKKLEATVKHARTVIELKFELAVNSIVNKRIVEGTYQLEGHGKSISTTAYDVIMGIDSYLNDNALRLTFPQMAELLERTTDDMLLAQRQWIADGLYPLDHPDMIPWDRQFSLNKWKEKAFNMVKPVVEKFNLKFRVELLKDMTRFKSLRYVNPMAMRKFEAVVPPTLTDDLLALRWAQFDRPFAARACAEFPAFVQRCKDVLHVEGDDNDPKRIMERSESFWATNYIDFPALTELVRYAWTSTSSSGSVERLFSVLKRTFTTQQLASAYIDYVEASCMLQFNKEFIKHFCDFLP
jgi:hypothetical protein